MHQRSHEGCEDLKDKIYIEKNENENNLSFLTERGDTIRKSQYTVVFPLKDKYLFLHGLSGAVKIVSRENARKFFDGEMVEELAPFFTHLTPEEEIEKAQSFCEFLMKNAQHCVDSTIAVTYDCNLRCPYCYEIWVKKPHTMKAVMNEYKVDKAFEGLEYLNRNCKKRKSLVLTGGEPLMKKNKDIVNYILKKGNDLDYSFIIFTNGVELDHFLSSFSSVSISYTQITLDGPRSLHDRRRIFKKGVGTFDTIVENIEKAREIGMPLKIRSNIDSEILSRIEELAQFFTERGWTADPHMRFSLVQEYDKTLNPEKTEQHIRIYEEIMDLGKKMEMNFFEAAPFIKLQSVFDDPPKFWPSFWHCNAVVKRYVFDPFGDIYPCRNMMGWKEECIGTYVPGLSFNENYTKWRKRTIFAMEKCTKCAFALVCGGDCGYASLLNKGDLFSPLCSIGQRTMVQYLEYLYDQSSKSVRTERVES